MQPKHQEQLEFSEFVKHIQIKKGELFDHQINILKKLQSSPKLAFSFGRQMGKTTLQYDMIKSYYEIINLPTYTKTVYLKNGSYIFEVFGYLLQKFRLRKIKGKWMATNIWYILKFLDRRGANKEVIAEIEKHLFEVLT